MGCATSKSTTVSNNNKNDFFKSVQTSGNPKLGVRELGARPSSGSGAVSFVIASAIELPPPTAGLASTPAAWDDDPYASLQVVLNDRQKRTIVKNWRTLSNDLSGRGSRIFQLIFVRNPRVRSLFSCGHLHGDELTSDERFRGHALRFMQAVGAVVNNLDNYAEVLAPLLNDLGRRHVGFKGFKPIYFNDFQESIMQVFAEDLGSKFNAQAREAWRLVLLFILTELKRGFTQCLREKSLQSAPSGNNGDSNRLQRMSTNSASMDDEKGDNCSITETTAMEIDVTISGQSSPSNRTSCLRENPTRKDVKQGEVTHHESC